MERIPEGWPAKGVHKNEDGSLTWVYRRYADDAPDLFMLREFCALWWGGVGCPLYSLGSQLYSPCISSLVLNVSPQEEWQLLHITSEQWAALVRAAKDQLEAVQGGDTSEAEEKYVDFASTILQIAGD